MAKAGSYLTDDFTFSGPVPQPIKKADFLALQGALVNAIPDWKFNAANMASQGNTVTGSVQITGTHTDTLAPIMPGIPALPPTQVRVKLPTEGVTAVIRGDKVASFQAEGVPGGVPGVLAQIGLQIPH